MKIQFFFGILLSSVFALNSQVMTYAEQAVLFSTDDFLGTARFSGMGGAFGALGNDMSGVDINPAGIAVYNGSEFSTSLAYRDTKINSTFYGNTIPNQDDHFRFSQIGAVSSWDIFGNPDVYKFAVGFNYSVIKDFNNNYLSQGNSGVPEFRDDPFLNSDDNPDNNVFYDNVDDQYFANYTSGLNDRFSFSFGTLYKEKFYFGGSLSFDHISFYQNTVYEELNNDGSGNTLDAYNNQSLSTYGNGFHFGLGTIILPTDNLRLGFSYQSPIWYTLSERYDEYLDIILSNTSDIYVESYDPNFFDYKLRTPSKFTGSLAYVFGSRGLISVDYLYQNFRNTRLSPSSAFLEDNQFLDSNLQNTSSVRIGTEWRFNIISLRGGYRFAQTPYKKDMYTGDLSGYSLGLGISFSPNFNLDFAYDRSAQDEQYSFLRIQGVEPTALDVTNDRFISTLLFRF